MRAYSTMSLIGVSSISTSQGPLGFVDTVSSPTL
jgi:hypothetical protein